MTDICKTPYNDREKRMVATSGYCYLQLHVNHDQVIQGVFKCRRLHSITI